MAPGENWFTRQPPLVQATASSIIGACDQINREVNRNFVYVRDGIEDFSIYKMSLLIKAGIPKQMMELVICFDKQSREYHCILRVFAGNREYILDNQHVNLLNKGSFNARYQAIFAISLSGWRLCQD